jgi:Predicted ATPases
MLIRVIAKNILSFYEATEFNMLPNTRKSRFSAHVYTDTIVPILKTTAIYGANGAGKSNLLEVFKILKEFIVKKEYLLTANLMDKKFKLAGPENSAPIELAIEFETNQKLFFYSVQINHDLIEKEDLYLTELAQEKDTLIFSRTRQKEKTVLSVKGKDGNPTLVNDAKLLSFLHENNAQSSFIAFNKNNYTPVIDSNELNDVFDWFDKKLEILSINYQIPQIIELIDKDEKFRELVNDLFPLFGIEVKNISVKTTPLSEVFKSEDEKSANLKNTILNDLKENSGIALGRRVVPMISFTTENGIEVAKELIFQQEGRNGFNGDLRVSEQSEGTLRMLNRLPILRDISSNDKVFLVDEIESSIHPILMKAFVNYFTSNKKTKGQLIFTTHECNLLDQNELLRPDEVWFAEKQQGATRLYSLNDFKEHNTIDIEKGYLSGRYGAIPFLGKLETLIHKIQ